jgi:uncharacterized protein (TIGR03435 family)
LAQCIQFAYGVKGYQILGLNSGDVRYDIAAKALTGTQTDEMRLAVQALLIERFKLTLHSETRILPVYDLVTGKNGPKLQAAVAGEHSGIGSRGGSVTARNVTMADFASALSRYMEMPVFDKTSLAGTFDFNMEYAPDDLSGQDRPSIFTAVQEQLGLKLQTAKAPIEVLVIDHAERVPSEN